MSEITEETALRRLKIGTTDIFLENLGPGKGKIIISDPYDGSYSTFWGSMGETIEEFILDLEFGYFHSNVNPHDDGVFDGKKTVTNFRKAIREEFTYELAWYKHLETQKELRKQLKSLESCDNQYDFFDAARTFADELDVSDIECKFDKEEFVLAIQELFSEPWHYFEMGPSRETRFLKKLFPELKKAIKKDLKKK